MSEGQPAVVDERVKAARKVVAKRARALAAAQVAYIKTLVRYEMEFGGDEPAAAAAVAPVEEEAEEPPAVPPKKTKVAKDPNEPWECCGNVITDEPCDVAAEERVRAADTRHDGKLLATCKSCKAAINKAKKSA
jgi:hypothetical protein